MTLSSESPGLPDLDGNSRRVWLLAFCLSLATALAIVSPYAWKGNASGHDFSFHAASWMDAAAQLRDGTWLPRWTEGANHGFGEPRFIFYPPLSWLLGAALSFIVPWSWVPAAFIVLAQSLAGLSAFALGRRLFGKREALCGAVCFAANPYALLIIYMRSDFAEQLALAFFPLLGLAALRVTGTISEHCRARPRSIIYLAAIFAVVWLTNAPAGVIASYSLAMLFTWTAIREKAWHPFVYGSAALVLGFGLAGFYLVPAAYEQRWVNIAEALSSGLQPSQNFLYTTISDPEHNAFNRIASNAAVLMIVLTGAFAAACYPKSKMSASRTASVSLWATLLVFAVTATFLMLPLSGIFWSILPKLRFVQFPWRWMSILAIPFACFIPAAMAQTRAAVAATMMIALAVTLGCAGAYMARHTWWDAEDIPTLLEAIDNDLGFEGVDEYDPVGDDHSALPEKSERIALRRASRQGGMPPEAKVHVEHWSAEKKEMRITTREPVLLSLRLLKYPAWRVEVNDTVVILPQTGETAGMVVPLAAGSSHVLARFTRTPDRTIGGILSAVSTLAATLLLFAFRRR